MDELARIYRRTAEVRYRIVDGEAVVVRQRAGEVMVLNPTGARILELVDGERPVASIVETLGEEVDAARATLEADVAAFLLELADAGVLEAVAEARADRQADQ